MRRFSSLEHKFQRNKELKVKYLDFMEQYEQLGHMSRVLEKEPPEYSFFLPQHGILKGSV